MIKWLIKKLKPHIKETVEELKPIIREIAIEAAKSYVKSEIEKSDKK